MDKKNHTGSRTRHECLRAVRLRNCEPTDLGTYTTTDTPSQRCDVTFKKIIYDQKNNPRMNKTDQRMIKNGEKGQQKWLTNRPNDQQMVKKLIENGHKQTLNGPKMVITRLTPFSAFPRFPSYFHRSHSFLDRFGVAGRPRKTIKRKTPQISRYFRRQI